MPHLPPAWINDVLQPITCALLIAALGAIQSASGRRRPGDRLLRRLARRLISGAAKKLRPDHRTAEACDESEPPPHPG